MTRAERIRAMSDEELGEFLEEVSGSIEAFDYCQRRMECSHLLECDELPPEEWCRSCRTAWLREEADGDPTG